MIVVVTRAYNAEKTIRRAVDSILNQTYGSFRYILLDNGSTDKTFEIIHEYAKKDNRIHPLHNEINSAKAMEKGNSVFFWNAKEIFALLQREYPECKYYCILDADDEYLPTFFEKAMNLINTYDLDIIACGSQSVQEQTGEPADRNYSAPYDRILLKPEDFIRYRTEYNEFMWTVWGKVYSLKVAQKNYIENPAKVSFYGNDTVSATKMFSYANRVGILSEKLHRNYVSQTSVSSIMEKSGNLDQDFLRTYMLYKTESEFLASKCGGHISLESRDLFDSYLSHTEWIVREILKMEFFALKKRLTIFRIVYVCLKTIGISGSFVIFGQFARRLFRKLRRTLFSK